MIPRDRLSLRRNVSLNVNLNQHFIYSQSGDLDGSPERFMIGRQLLQVTNHCVKRRLAHRTMISHDSEDVFGGCAGLLEGVGDVLKGLVDLLLLRGAIHAGQFA